LKEDEIRLFLIFCLKNPKAKALPKSQIRINRIPIIKNEEFKTFATFEE